ncbi:MAG: hypothetical protein PHQ23_13215 [Candidatus Wallbacteria bacterium]|nr:hypothetical protein [Candidatus Wallbacteria bacterium]
MKKGELTMPDKQDGSRNAEDQDLFIVCECNSCEHVIRLTSYADDDDLMYLHIHLRPEHSLWKRIVRAVRYVCGRRSRFGDFDEFVIGPRNIDRIYQALGQARDRYAEQQEKKE